MSALLSRLYIGGERVESSASDIWVVGLKRRIEAMQTRTIRRLHFGISLDPRAAEMEEQKRTDLLTWSHELRGAARSRHPRSTVLQHSPVVNLS